MMFQVQVHTIQSLKSLNQAYKLKEWDKQKEKPLWKYKEMTSQVQVTITKVQLLVLKDFLWEPNHQLNTMKIQDLVHMMLEMT